MAGFFMVIADDGSNPATRYEAIEQAQEVAEQLAKRTGADVFVMKAVLQASVRRVEWTPIAS